MNQTLKDFADLCGRILAEMWIAEQKLKAEQKGAVRGGQAATRASVKGEAHKKCEKDQ